jgi:hypothetical protein
MWLEAGAAQSVDWQNCGNIPLRHLEIQETQK